MQKERKEELHRRYKRMGESSEVKLDTIGSVLEITKDQGYEKTIDQIQKYSMKLAMKSFQLTDLLFVKNKITIHICKLVVDSQTKKFDLP